MTTSHDHSNSSLTSNEDSMDSIRLQPSISFRSNNSNNSSDSHSSKKARRKQQQQQHGSSKRAIKKLLHQPSHHIKRPPLKSALVNATATAADATADATNTSNTSIPLLVLDNENENNRSNPNNKSVSFRRTVKNRRIPHLNDISPKEKAATWISVKEYTHIKKRCILTVQQMIKYQGCVGIYYDPSLKDYHCTRGLEGKTKKGAHQRRELKLDAIAAVLEEQECYDDDCDAIMEVYSIYSVPSHQAAHELGLEDAAAVLEYLEQDLKARTKKKTRRVAGKSDTTASRTQNCGTTSTLSTAEKSTTATPTTACTTPTNTIARPSSLDPIIETTTAVATTAQPPSSIHQTLAKLFSFKKQRTDLLAEIESSYYDEAAMGRRRVTSQFLQSLRQYFQNVPSPKQVLRKHHKSVVAADSTASSKHQHRTAGKQNNSDHTPNTQPESESETDDHVVERPTVIQLLERNVSIADHEESSSCDLFTSQLNDIFHARKRRRALLDDIVQRGYYSQCDSKKSRNVVSVDLARRLQHIYTAKTKRHALMEELDHSSHICQKYSTK